MLSEKLPLCLCENHSWESQGASVSPNISQSNFVCDSCDRKAIFLSHRGGNVFVIVSTPGSDLPEDFENWFTNVLCPTWRDCVMRRKKVQEPIEKRWWNYACDEIGIPREIKAHDVPEDKRRQWGAFWDVLEQYEHYKRPVGFEKTITPPKIPAGIEAFVSTVNTHKKLEWEKVDRAKSWELPVPDDPIRVGHDAFYSKVFDEVRAKLGQGFETKQITNEYLHSENEPWFMFHFGDSILKVGPRKRVVSIKLTSPGFKTETLRKAAAEVDTTYYADKGWKSDAPIAREIEVHAWNEEQIVKFLCIIGEQSLGLASA